MSPPPPPPPESRSPKKPRGNKVKMNDKLSRMNDDLFKILDIYSQLKSISLIS